MKKKYKNLVLTYFTKKKLTKIIKCPNCGSINNNYIESKLVPNVIGFLNNKNLYKNCLKCEYIFLEKQVSENDLHIYYKYYTYPNLEKKVLEEIAKKPSKKNISHFLNFANIKKVFECKNRLKLLDLGSGNCGFAFYIKKNFNHNVQNYDFNFNKKLIPLLKKKKIFFKKGNIINLIKEDLVKNKKYDIITLWEVIEHIKINKLKKILEYLNGILADKGKLIISTLDYDNPICKMFDFWSSFPGEHLSVFRKNFLINFFKKYNFSLKKTSYEAVYLKHNSAWLDYFSLNKNKIVSSFASLLKYSLKNEKINNQFNYSLKKHNLGSEIIMIFEKIS